MLRHEHYRAMSLMMTTHWSFILLMVSHTVTCLHYADLKLNSSSACSQIVIMRFFRYLFSCHLTICWSSNFSSSIRYQSTWAAACRPSEMAHTTSDCPRRQSPVAKTASTLVEQWSYSALKFDGLSRSKPNLPAIVWMILKKQKETPFRKQRSGIFFNKFVVS